MNLRETTGEIYKLWVILNSQLVRMLSFNSLHTYLTCHWQLNTHKKNVFLIPKTPVVVQKMINTINMQLLIWRIHFKCQDREESY